MEKKTLEILDFPKIVELLRNCCDSSLGKALATDAKPFSLQADVMRLLDETEAAYEVLMSESTPTFAGLRDISEAVNRAQKGGILKPEEGLDIIVSLETFAELSHFFKQELLEGTLLGGIGSGLADLPNLYNLLTRTFDERGNIKDNASPQLSRLRREQFRLQERVKKEIADLLQNKSLDKAFQENLITVRNGRYVIPIKAEYRHSVPGIVQGRSATGQTLYIEPMISVELNNDLQEAILAEEEEIKRILANVSAGVAEEAENILENSSIAANLDYIFARGKLAHQMRAVRARESVGNVISAPKMRHPLLAEDKVVPISIFLGDGYRILAITGSNTGGKTVALKTLGLLAAMNQAGLFIPAENGASLPIFSNIWAAIGDDQSIEESLSTFSGQMSRIISIMEHTEPTDLVLLDELGTGTDPIEGAALAIAILDYFWEKECLAVVTTHYSELKQYVYTHEGMENAHVEFDEKTLSPTYRLHIGIAGNSQALGISKRLGMLPQVLERAEYLKKQSSFYEMETVLEELNEKRKELSIKEAELADTLAKAKRAHEKWQQENRELQRKKTSVMQQVRDDAKNLKRELRVEAENIIKELKRGAQEHDPDGKDILIRNARSAIEGVQVPIGKERTKIPIRKLKVGMQVYVDTLEKVGKLVSVEGKRLQVEVGGFQVTVKPSHCYYPQGEDEVVKSKATPIRRGKVEPYFREVGQEINVIGLTVDEAMPDVEAFLDAAVMAGLPAVSIIHGKGTGTLRKAIHERLRSLPYVVSFGIADAALGGSGVTIVKLK